MEPTSSGAGAQPDPDFPNLATAPDEGSGPAAGEAPTGPAPGSDAAFSQEFARNLTRLREERGLTLNQLAALSDIDLDSLKKYESGRYRPKAPKLLQLARALDVMPISLGPSAVRGTEPPLSFDVLLRKRGSRALRVQRLAELLAGQRVSVLAQAAGLEVEALYTLAASETQLSDAALEPMLRGLPTVRASWLLSGEGDPLLPPAPVARPVPEAATPGEAAPAMGLGLALSRPDAEPPAPHGEVSGAGSVGPRRLPVPGGGCYLPLATGQLVEVLTIPTADGPALTQLRLLAGAGQLPGVTAGDQLDALYQALRDLLSPVSPLATA